MTELGSCCTGVDKIGRWHELRWGQRTGALWEDSSVSAARPSQSGPLHFIVTHPWLHRTGAPSSTPIASSVYKASNHSGGFALALAFTWH